MSFTYYHPAGERPKDQNPQETLLPPITWIFQQISPIQEEKPWSQPWPSSFAGSQPGFHPSQNQSQPPLQKTRHISDSVSDSDRKARQSARKRKKTSVRYGGCHMCGITESPEWRKGPDGLNTLCNACGLQYAKKLRQMAAQNPTPPASIFDLH